MKQILLAAALLGGILAGCTNSNKQTTDNNMEQKLTLTQEWDKVFPLSEKVNHKKVTFETQYGLTLAADLYTPKEVREVKEVNGVKKVTVKRVIDGGVETVEAPLPVVITVNGSAAPCRPQNAKLVMKYKRATCPMERPAEGTAYDYLYDERPELTLNQWSVADVDGDVNQCGLSGSPTKVKAIKNIVFQAKESKTLTASDADIEGMIKELLEEKIIG